ncbi:MULTISPECIES: EVE domain-containing protein [Cellvibrio]|jgi:predicted RNA-binding protein with PUA-like domain|uniref:RNA-binding protein with PUA-like domain n=1 Tax=Cellvibrio fibrivorans TaxID=126350 RepID=A0ABU1UWV4_9GAMM|nr:EVE domain-containing protein [Cellvibrio fibrivorans]MDR7089669.1 putative RNA-binding protein with PUA-like domain [Cellvibrio fibrivorans]
MAKKYWLFKAEPHIYGIDHLAAAPDKIGRWDGIRNYQARNFLRDQVALNDEVFIYHSSCKNVGIVGTAKVVKTAYPDPTQFNPESDYYDPKSTPENPRWVSVDIKLTKVFPRLIALAEIKAQPRLENMILVKQSRLSTQPVTVDEWKLINDLL